MVKIDGLKYLDANCYDSIMIREKDGFNVDVKLQNLEFNELLSLQKFKGQLVSSKFSTELKNKTEKEKIIEIIKKYLEYSIIYGITSIYHLSHYDGWFNKISGTRNLYLQISNVKDIYQMILKKYTDDRLKFCSNNEDINSYKVVINNYSTSYQRYENCIYLNLLSDNNIIVNFEKEFLKDFIFSKLYEIGKIAEMKYITNRMEFTKNINSYGYYIICGDLTINLSGNDKQLKDILICVEKYLNEYNTELKQSKILQLKIKGFSEKS